MAYNIVMPQLSDSMEEGKLISWKVKPGDTVHQGDVVAEVESDKAIMEVQTFKDGVVKELRLKEGESAPVGSVIAVIETEGSKGEAPQSSGEKSKPAAAASESSPAPTPEKSKKPSSAETEAPAPKAKSEEPAILSELFGQSQESRPAAGSHPAGGEAPASPKARALAARLGLEIEALQKEGKLPVPTHAEDLRRYYARRYFTPKALELLEAYNLSPDLFKPGKKHTEKEVLAYIEEHAVPKAKPLDGMRKAIIATVTEAQKKPVFHIYDTLDATLLKKYESRERTVTVWLIKLLGEAMMRHEAVRTTLGENGLQVWPGASLCVAMAHGEALYMPVFKNVDQKSVDEVAKELADYKTKVKNGRVGPEDLKGSTFGLSNLGMTGIERFDAMVGGNDSGIVAVGSERDGRIAVTFTFDHRVVNGWQGAEFVQTLKSLAEDESQFKT